MVIEDIIGNSLRLGVIIGTALILVGIIISLNSGQTAQNAADLNTASVTPTSIMMLLYQLNWAGYVMLGLIIIIATPVLRVFLSVINFAYERNALYAIITAIVLFDLMVAILIIPGLLHA
jgi:uncharacterized membrane protein